LSKVEQIPGTELRRRPPLDASSLGGADFRFDSCSDCCGDLVLDIEHSVHVVVVSLRPHVPPALGFDESRADAQASTDVGNAERPTNSLYDRLGGVYNIATVVDNFIERLLVNDTLNANPAINEARARVPKAPQVPGDRSRV
jgi:hypothetical protein